MRHWLVPILSLAIGGFAAAQDGAAIYQQRCALCHDASAGRVPSRSDLAAKGVPAILNALQNGIMKTQADGLSNQELIALTLFLSVPPAAAQGTTPASAKCGSGAAPFTVSAPAWTAWGVNASNTRFQLAEAAGVSAADVPKLRLKWAFGLGPGADARSQPAIAFGRVFVGSLNNEIHALDARTGCLHWSFSTSGVPQRGGIVAGMAGDRPAVFFSDGSTTARALDAETGALLWKSAKLESHFAAMGTGAPLLYRGVLYVPISSFEEAIAPLPGYECCTFRGGVVALDAATGERLWKAYTIPEAATKGDARMYGPSGAGVWSTPTFDEERNAVYVATGDNYSDPASETSDAVVAFDASTGKMLWSRQLTEADTFNLACSLPGAPGCPEKPGPDFDFGQPPILVSLGEGKRALVIGQKSGLAHALDPDNQGAILWQTRVGRGTALGGSQWGSASGGSRMYVASSDIGFTGMRPDPANPMGIRMLADPKKGGGLTALDLETGKVVWRADPPACTRENCSPAQSAAVTVIPGVVFSGSIDGHLRAYSADTGEIVWDVDTIREYDTVNGLPAKGGSLNVAGPVIAGGLVLATSGYGQYGGVPGNVLLAFSAE